MIRVALYIAAIFAVAAGIAWLADRPGDVTLVWLGYEIRTSLMVAALAVVILLAALVLAWSILRGLWRTPEAIGGYFAARRRDKGYRALSRGMIAVGAGDARLAGRYSREADRHLLGEPLTLLLSAQAAQLKDDRPAARSAFETMLAGPETRMLGLHGLFVEARRQGEHGAARQYAEEAMRLRPGIAWAGPALFEYQAAEGDWRGALSTLAANRDAGTVGRDEAHRLQAVLETAQALEMEAGAPDQALTHGLSAHKLAPDLVPAALVSARLASRLGDVRKAVKVLETTWKKSPHPDLAAAYAAVRPGDSVRDRLRRVKRLAEQRAHHPEGALALARTAIDAHAWADARAALAGFTEGRPSQRVCLLMAEIEEGEHGDRGRVRDWLSRAVRAPRDPAWTADGYVFDDWAPVSPVTGRVDAFEWKVPGGRMEPEAPAIEASPAEARPALAGPTTDDATDLEPVDDHGPAPSAATASAPGGIDGLTAGRRAAAIRAGPPAVVVETQSPAAPAAALPVVVPAETTPAANEPAAAAPVAATAAEPPAATDRANGTLPPADEVRPDETRPKDDPLFGLPRPPDDPGPEEGDDAPAARRRFGLFQ